jgi:prepilin-type processing-associated H-X9-DG protein
MNAYRRRRSFRAFTVVELLVVIVVVFFLVVLFLPSSGSIFPQRRRINSPRIHCVNNLKQVGLAFRMWSDDNSDMYPMQVLTNQTGAFLFADATNGFRYFEALSNELSTPKILVCPSDKRVPATNFTTDFNGAHVSYFIGLEADVTLAGAFLGGDRNITNGRAPINGILELQTNQNIGWTSELHNGFGNVLLGDGSVQQVNSPGVKQLLASTGLATNRLLLPP